MDPETMHFAPQETYCVSGEGSGDWLLAALREMGLAPHEATEMATYWGALMAAHKWVAVRFLPQEVVGKRFPLSVVGEGGGGEDGLEGEGGVEGVQPDLVLRVYLIFKSLAEPIPGYRTSEEFPTSFVSAEALEREGKFVVVEWGGVRM
jgi:hypothetical protein